MTSLITYGLLLTALLPCPSLILPSVLTSLWVFLAHLHPFLSLTCALQFVSTPYSKVFFLCLICPPFALFRMWVSLTHLSLFLPYPDMFCSLCTLGSKCPSFPSFLPMFWHAPFLQSPGSEWCSLLATFLYSDLSPLVLSRKWVPLPCYLSVL